MIRLDLNGTTTGPVTVEDLDTAEQELRKFDATDHVQRQGSDVHIIGMFGPENEVPDVNRYRVTVRNGKCNVQPHPDCHKQVEKSNFNDLEANHGGYDSTIMLLLESPHRDEYEDDDPRCPIAPAQGSTGRNIENFLGCSLNKPEMVDEIRGNGRVIIANPVPYQTSLWTIHKENLNDKNPDMKWTTVLRDAVWTTLWNESQIRHKFCCRLRGYNPDIVLNCCTENLRKHVADALGKCDLNALTYEAGHPASWRKAVKFRQVN